MDIHKRHTYNGPNTHQYIKWGLKDSNQNTHTYMANFYRLVRVPAWVWNLDFCTKRGIQKSRYHFLRVWHHKKFFAIILTLFFFFFVRTFWPFLALSTRVLSILWPGWYPLSVLPPDKKSPHVYDETHPHSRFIVFRDIHGLAADFLTDLNIPEDYDVLTLKECSFRDSCDRCSTHKEENKPVVQKERIAILHVSILFYWHFHSSW